MTCMHANDMSSTTSLTPATPAFTLQALPARSLRAAAAPAPAPLAPAPAPLASDAVLPAATIALTAEEVAKHTTLDDCWCACLCGALGHRACRATISPSPAPSSSPSINVVRYIYKNAVYDVTAYMADDLHPGEIGMRTAAATCSGRHSHPSPMCRTPCRLCKPSVRLRQEHCQAGMLTGHPPVQPCRAAGNEVIIEYCGKDATEVS